MSFRIEDILKDTKVREKKVTIANEKCAHDDNNANSILQQTLLNNNNISYCFQKVSSDYAEKIQESYRQIRSAYLSPYNCMDYVQKAYPYLSNNVYCSRNRYYYPPIYYGGGVHLPFSHYSKRKGGQVRFTTNQTDALEKRFVSHKYLSPEDRKTLADALKLTDRQVKTWFQNRRAKWRRVNSVSSSNTDTNNDSESDIEICNGNNIGELIRKQ